jgi:uncharacterized membrane protein YcaP (DUF421 family)
MYETIASWLGTGTELGALQMSLRAGAIFVITLLLLRISGRRSFGQKSPFDLCVAVLLGAVLSRAVVGASPFWPVVAAAALIVVLHRGFALVSCKSEWFDALINGRPRVLVTNGVVDQESMRRALVTMHDLEEAIRKKAGTESLDVVARAVLERNGKITVVLQSQG